MSAPDQTWCDLRLVPGVDYDPADFVEVSYRVPEDRWIALHRRWYLRTVAALVVGLAVGLVVGAVL